MNIDHQSPNRQMSQNTVALKILAKHLKMKWTKLVWLSVGCLPELKPSPGPHRLKLGNWLYLIKRLKGDGCRDDCHQSLSLCQGKNTSLGISYFVLDPEPTFWCNHQHHSNKVLLLVRNIFPMWAEIWRILWKHLCHTACTPYTPVLHRPSCLTGKLLFLFSLFK